MNDEIKDGIFNAINERFSSPLFNGFIVSWCILNYKFIVILLSNNTVSVTFDLIGEIAFKSKFDVFIFGFAIPLFSSLVYIFVYPIPAELIYKYQKFWQGRKEKIAFELELNRPVSAERARELLGDNYNKKNQIAELEGKLLQVEEERDRYAARLSVVNARNNNLPSGGSWAKKSTISDLAKKILLYMHGKPSATIEELSNGIGVPSDYLNSEINLLISNYLIEKSKDGTCKISSQGIDYVLENYVMT